MKVFLLAGLVLTALATPLLAVPYHYEICGYVTTAPNEENVFPEGPKWDFPSLPSAFCGSFIADDQHAGPISNFSLMIGGIDVPAFHPENTFPLAGGGLGELNFFNPWTETLRWAGIDENRNTTFVSIGATVPGIPHDRIVAVQFTDPQILPPGDPVFLSTINWVGTFEVKKGERVRRVPESGATMASATLGLGGLLLLNAWSRRKKHP